MSSSSKSSDLSFLLTRGYTFGVKLHKILPLKVKFGDKDLVCKIVKRKKNNSKDLEKLEILRELSHPHIIRIHEILRNGNSAFIFTPWIDEGDLMSLIKNVGVIKEAKANFWFYQMVCALKYLRAMKIAHCNLSCDHIMMSKNNVKISGLSHMRHCLEGEKYSANPSKSLAPFYLPPEVNKGEPCDIQKADIYTLGVILFMMLNAKVPFCEPKLKQLVDDQMNRRFTHRTSNINALSVDSQVMIYTLLEPNPELRWDIEKVYSMKWLSKYVDKQGDF